MIKKIGIPAGYLNRIAKKKARIIKNRAFFNGTARLLAYFNYSSISSRSHTDSPSLISVAFRCGYVVMRK